MGGVAGLSARSTKRLSSGGESGAVRLNTRVVDYAKITWGIGV